MIERDKFFKIEKKGKFNVTKMAHGFTLMSLKVLGLFFSMF
jgi:hypothetical protein